MREKGGRRQAKLCERREVGQAKLRERREGGNRLNHAREGVKATGEIMRENRREVGRWSKLCERRDGGDT